MFEMHLRQSGFTCRTCWKFTKNKERVQKFRETRDSRSTYWSNLDYVYFQHGMAYKEF